GRRVGRDGRSRHVPREAGPVQPRAFLDPLTSAECGVPRPTPGWGGELRTPHSRDRADLEEGLPERPGGRDNGRNHSGRSGRGPGGQEASGDDWLDATPGAVRIAVADAAGPGRVDRASGGRDLAHGADL